MCQAYGPWLHAQGPAIWFNCRGHKTSWMPLSQIQRCLLVAESALQMLGSQGGLAVLEPIQMAENTRMVEQVANIDEINESRTRPFAISV